MQQLLAPQEEQAQQVAHLWLWTLLVVQEVLEASIPSHHLSTMVHLDTEILGGTGLYFAGAASVDSSAVAAASESWSCKTKRRP